MRAADWLRGRPDPALTDFWLDPRLPARTLDELIETAVREWDSDAEWPPYLAALTWRGDEATLAAALELLGRDDPRARAVGAYVLGQLGIPERTHPQESADALERHAEGEEDPEVLATIASAFGNLGPRYGLETLLRLRRHADPRVREGAAEALAGRDEERVFDAAGRAHRRPRAGHPRLGHLRARHALAAGHADPPRRPRRPPRRQRRQHAHRSRPRPGAARRRPRARRHARPARRGRPARRRRQRADTIWKRYALTQATVRLAALTGDAA
jgi:HEAT repeat protein